MHALACHPTTPYPGGVEFYLQGYPGGQWILPHWQTEPDTIIACQITTRGNPYNIPLLEAVFAAYPGYQASGPPGSPSTESAYVSAVPRFLAELLQWHEDDDDQVSTDVLRIPEEIRQRLGLERVARLLARTWHRTFRTGALTTRFCEMWEAAEANGVAFEELVELSMTLWEDRGDWDQAIEQAILLSARRG